MGKHKMQAMEAFMDRMLDETTVVKINGEIWPYLINRHGNVWGRPFIEVKPYIDSRKGNLMHTLRKGDEEYTISLQLLMAMMFIPNENGYNDARLKSGDPGAMSSYTVDNIEWYENENVDAIATTKTIDTQKDIAIVSWCRRRQGFGDKEIAAELGITSDAVKDLITKYDQKLINDFQFKTDPGTTRRKKLKVIRPFIVYLINCGIHNDKIADQVRLLVPEADTEQAKRNIRNVRDTDIRVRPELKRK